MPPFLANNSLHFSSTESAPLSLADGTLKDYSTSSSAMVRAAAIGNGARVVKILEGKRSDWEINQSLIAAADNGHVNVLDVLIPLCQAEKSIHKALRGAAINGRREAVERLMPHCDPKAHGSTAIRGAAMCGYLDIVDLLIPVSDPNVDASIALRWAAKHGHVDVVKRLLPLSKSLSSNSSALQLAAGTGKLEVVDLLIGAADPLEDHSAALRSAAMGNHSQIIQRLIPCSDPLAAGDLLAKEAKWQALDLLGVAVDASLRKHWLANHAAHLPGCSVQQLALDRVEKVAHLDHHANEIARRPRC